MPNSTLASRIAVIIPVHAAHYLGECLQSVFSQTLAPDQVIVVDDGSPDADLFDKAIAGYGDRVTVIRQRNLGAGAARNRGIQYASADLIAFLDADDLWCPDLLEHQVRVMTQRPECDLVYANGRLIGEGPLRGQLFTDAAPSRGEPTLEALLQQRCTVLTSSVLVRRDAVIGVGLFDEHLRRGQDFDLWVRLAAAGSRLAYTADVLMFRRIHGVNLSGDPVTELERAITVLTRLRTKIAFTADEEEALTARVGLLKRELHAEHGKRELAAGAVTSATAHFRAAAKAGAGWKVQAVHLALRVAPRLTHHAYVRARGERMPLPGMA